MKTKETKCPYCSTTIPSVCTLYENSAVTKCPKCKALVDLEREKES